MATRTELEKRLENILAHDPKTEDLAIDVIEENGLVTLDGTVPSEKARREVEALVEKQKGVLEVVNELEVASEEDGPGEVLPSSPVSPMGDQ
jgi:osmotically-inducible protein OsmY